MNCLTISQIEEALLLADDSDSGDSTYVEQHLETCESCRSRLEHSAGTAGDWKTTCSLLGSAITEIESAGDTSSNDFESSFFYRVDIEGQPLTEEFSSEGLGTLLDSPGHPENLGRIGRYEIERTIGRGGMGVVFKGFDSELNRPVAIKILSPHLAGHGTARQRFAREAKAAAAVVHDNVVQIFDIQADSHRPFIVMPFVNGVSLQSFVDSHGQIGVKNILRVALQIASGLAAAHAQGLIHRDIKPGNVLLENGLNRVQITDFGLARAVDDAAMTHSSLIAGTPQYMSPEQAKGAALDHRSDVFSLGCVMYFMATGRTLYRGDGPYSVIAQLCKGNYKPVREINANIPTFVADIIDKLLEIEPQDRFQSASQLVHHLETSLAYLHQPTANKAPQKIWSSRRKKTWKRIVGAGALVILACVGIGAAWGAFHFGSTLPDQNDQPLAESQDSKMNESKMPKSLQTFQDLESDLNLVESQLGELEDLMHWSDPAGETTDEHVHSFDFGIEQQLIELTHELDEFEPRFQPEPSDPYWAPTRRSGQQESEKKFNERPDRFPNNSSSNRPLQNIDASTQLPLSGKSQNKDSK